MIDKEASDEENDGKYKKIYPHMMRHSCATWLMEAGTDIEVACSYLGMTEAVLRKHYWKHHPSFQEAPKNLF